MVEKNIALEICCGSVDDVVQAQNGGADRVELNCALELGGLTPSSGQIITAVELTTIPIMAMVRPRSGGFCYTDNEFMQMCSDVETMIMSGADGIVFGILTQDGHVDVDKCRVILEIAQQAACQIDADVDYVFHRAIDSVPNWKEAFSQIIDLGFDRVLTSGQAPSAMEGIETIKAMNDFSSELEVLPGCGIRSDNIVRLIQESGCSQVHMSSSKWVTDTSTDFSIKNSVMFNTKSPISENSYKTTDKNQVKILKKMINNCSDTL